MLGIILLMTKKQFEWLFLLAIGKFILFSGYKKF